MQAGDSWGTPERVSAASAPRLKAWGMPTFKTAAMYRNPVLAFIRRLPTCRVGVLVAERYRLIEEQPEGNGGRLFLAHEEKAGRTSPVHVALKLIHPEIAAVFGFVKGGDQAD